MALDIGDVYLDGHVDLSSKLKLIAAAAADSITDDALAGGSVAKAVSARTKAGVTPLLVAAYKGHEASASALLRASASAEVTSGRGCTALHFAAHSGSAAVMEMLLAHPKAGRLIEATDNRGMPPLLVGCQVNGVGAVGALLEHRASMSHSRVSDGYGALHITSLNDAVETAQLLLDSRADVNERIKHPSENPRQDNDGKTALHVAAQNGMSRMCTFLLDRGALLEARSTRWQTAPLLEAAKHQHLHIITLLIERKALVDAVTSDNSTAFHESVFTRNVACTRALLRAGANVCHFRQDGANALGLAAEAGCLEVAQLLLRFDHPADLAKESHPTPLLIACQNGHSKMVELLLKNGASASRQLRLTMADNLLSSHVTRRQTHIATPLCCACIHGQVQGPSAADKLEIVRLLVEFKADVNLGAMHGMTPLHMACGAAPESSPNEPVVELLLRAKATPESRDNEGMSPLGYLLKACAKAKTPQPSLSSLVSLLLKSRADPSAPISADNDTTTPLQMIAAACQCEAQAVSVAHLLLDSGARADVADKRGLTALLLAYNIKGYRKLCDVLAPQGWDGEALERMWQAKAKEFGGGAAHGAAAGGAGVGGAPPGGVAALMNDPSFRSLLERMQSDPAFAAQALQNPELQSVFQALAEAGVLEVRPRG